MTAICLMLPSAAEASCLATVEEAMEVALGFSWLGHARLSRIGEPAEPESACSPGTSQTRELEDSHRFGASTETGHVGKSQDVLVGAWRSRGGDSNLD